MQLKAEVEQKLSHELSSKEKSWKMNGFPKDAMPVQDGAVRCAETVVVTNPVLQVPPLEARVAEETCPLGKGECTLRVTVDSVGVVGETIAVDVDVLRTQDLRELRSGLAECLKHALAQDADYAAWLDGPHDLRDPAFLEAVVRRNIELKCALMAEDPKELGCGMALQYGHTVGHPLEHLSGYRLAHGEAVALGMMVAAHVARLMGASDLVEVHRRLLARHGLPTSVPSGLSTADVLAAMRYNKRYLVEGTRMALVDRVGGLWSVDGEFAIPVSEVVLERAIEQARGGGAGAAPDCGLDARRAVLEVSA